VIKLLVAITKADHLSSAHKIVSSVLLQGSLRMQTILSVTWTSKKSHDSIRRQVLCNIVTALGITIKTGDIINPLALEMDI